MFENKTEQQAKEEILKMVAEYCDTYHNKKEYHEGDRIPYASRVYDHAEMCNLVDSALEFWLTAGRYTDEFEKKFAEYLGVRYCALVNSGSSANLVAFMTLTSPLLGDRKINRGDEVITVAAGFPTTIAAMIQYGAVPVFVDMTIPQYNIDVTQLEAALSDKTKAVMIAHTLGNPFDLAAVKAFCDKHNLWLVEDNCDALGSTYTIDGVTKQTGTIGDIGTSSFYPPHHMTMGEGGAVYTDDPLLIRSSAPCVTGGVTASVRPVVTICAVTALTDSTESFRSVMIISMYILILDIISRQPICRRLSAVRSSRSSLPLWSAESITSAV